MARRAAWLMALLLSPGCGAPEERPEMPPDGAGVRELREALKALEEQDDLDALLSRIEICSRLRKIGVPDEDELQVRADQAGMEVMSRPAPLEIKREVALLLARTFRERARSDHLSRLDYPGPLGLGLRKMVLLRVAANFADFAVSPLQAELWEGVSGMLEQIGEEPALNAEAKRHFKGEARDLLRKAAALRKEPPASATPEARKFCEMSVEGHLDQGTRDADFGTRDKTDRSKAIQVLHWYQSALMHFAAVKETRLSLTPTEEIGLSRQDIVVRSLCDLLCEP